MKPAYNRQAGSFGGYTIVETMIFLIISAFLLLSVIGLFSGRIQRTQFTQSAQALATRITTTSNEVATGTYPTSPAFTCKNSGGIPTPTALVGSPEDLQGTRSDCIFVGKIMNFTVKGPQCVDPVSSSQCKSIDTYTVIGRRELNSTDHTIVTTLFGGNGSKPRMILTPSLTSSFTPGYGTHAVALYLQQSGGTKVPISSVGFFQSFGGTYNAAGSLSSGSQAPSMWVIKTTADPKTPQTDRTTSDALNAEQIVGLGPSDAVLLCVQSGSSGQKAAISIGAANGSFVANVTVGDSRC